MSAKLLLLEFLLKKKVMNDKRTMLNGPSHDRI